MSISNLVIDKANCLLHWNSGEKIISKALNNIIIAAIKKDEKLIYVEIGKDFVVDSVIYFSADGTELFSYDLLTSVVKWRRNKNSITLTIQNLFHAEYYILNSTIIVLNEQDGNKQLHGYDENGNSIFSNIFDSDLVPLYLSSTNKKPSVVCKTYSDQFGRKDRHFSINLKDGSLNNENLAY